MEDLEADLNRTAAEFEEAIARRAAAETDSERDEAEAAIARTHALAQHQLALLADRERQLFDGLPPDLRSEASRLVEQLESRARETVTDRATLNARPPTGAIEHALERGLPALLTRLSTDWLSREQAKGGHRMELTDLARPFSVVSSVRLKPDTGQHSFAHAVLQAVDFMNERPERDAFSGALPVAEIARLCTLLPALGQVPGSDERIRRLWKGSSEDSLSTLYELVVAGSLAQAGRDVEFIDEGQARSSDLRLLDSVGATTTVECKRKRGLTEVEVEEGRAVDALFNHLLASLKGAGRYGTVSAEFEEQPQAVDPDSFLQVVSRAISSPGEAVQGPWGSVKFAESDERFGTGETVAFSPIFIARAFGYDVEMPEWDGVVGQVSRPEDFVVEEARQPLGLRWRSVSERSTRARARSLRSLLSSATGQVPVGGIGHVYIAYQDGARESVSQERIDFITTQMRETELRHPVHMPVVIVNRLLGRPMGHGAPDLIENTILYADSHGGEAWLEDLPARVYTP